MSDAAQQPSGLLSELLAGLPADRPLKLGELTDRIGSHGHALVMLLLSVPEIIPLLPSASWVLGFPLLAVSLHLTIFGRSSSLPGWLERRTIPAVVAEALRVRVPKALARFESLSRRRWLALARRARLVGFVCMLLTLMLLLPIPLLNSPPALCIIILSLGLIQRDGVLVAIGMGLAVAVGALITFVTIVGWEAMTSILG